MLADIGLIALIMAFFLALYSTLASGYGGWKDRYPFIQSGRNAALITFPLLTISVVILVYSLVSLDFSLAYVADVSSRAMAPFFRLTALWGGQAGSILFWAWLMAGFVVVVARRKWDADRELLPFVLLVAMGTTAFFIGLSVFIDNPFARLWHVEGASKLTTAIFRPENAMAYLLQDGNGLNPLLRHFGMIGHPPTTYLGFTGFVIPYAFAIAALIKGKVNDDAWIKTTRRWTLFAWLFLSIGLVLGGRWAYDVLGWGGFWGWDPVENAMLLPWLTATAFLHSVMIQEKRGMLKAWNFILIILTYSLILFGTFITRTGIIDSVHSFAKSALGPVFFAFIGFTFIGSISLLLRNLRQLKSENEIESFFSREAAFLFQNMLFLAVTFAVFWGTIFPMISEVVTGTKMTVGPPFFKKVAGPLFSVILLLMAIAPFVAWRRQKVSKLANALLWPFIISLIVSTAWVSFHSQHPASAFSLWMISFVWLSILWEFWRGIRARMKNKNENPLLALKRLIGRNHRRYGGYIVHLGVLMIAMGFIGDSFFKSETQGAISVGEELQIGRYTLRFDNLLQYPGSDGREILEASTSLFKDGEYIRRLLPRRDFFIVQNQPVSVPGVYSTLAEDVYVLLIGWEDIGKESSTFKIYVNPLINWTWIGGVVLVLGVLVAAMPLGRQVMQSSYVLRRQPLKPSLEMEG